MKTNQRSLSGLICAIASLKQALLLMQIESVEAEVLQHEPELRKMLESSANIVESSNSSVVNEIRMKLDQLKELKGELERTRNLRLPCGGYHAGKENFGQLFQ